MPIRPEERARYPLQRGLGIAAEDRTARTRRHARFKTKLQRGLGIAAEDRK